MRKVSYGMRHPLLFASKLARLAVLFVMVLGLCLLPLQNTAAMGVTQNPPELTDLEAWSQPILLDTPQEMRIAHHGGEGTSAAAVGGVATSAQLLATSPAAAVSFASESLWGNLLLTMAYQRDSELQRLAKKLGRVNTWTLVSLAGISGLGLAQSINALQNIHEPQRIDVEDHGSGAHIHLEGESKTPATLGIISSSATLVTLGVKSLVEMHYRRRMAIRQQLIQTQVASILSRLNAGTPFQTIAPELSRLVGQTATTEFGQLWQATHPTVAP